MSRNYVFYEGSWKFWADNELDTKSMTIREYDKEFILTRMGLTVQKAPLFVALTGGLSSNEKHKMVIYKYFCPFDASFEKVLNLVNSQTFPITKLALNGIVKMIFGYNMNFKNICEDFHRTLNLMNPKLLRNPFSKDVNCPQNDLMNYHEFISANDPIYISPIFLDAR